MENTAGAVVTKSFLARGKTLVLPAQPLALAQNVHERKSHGLGGLSITPPTPALAQYKQKRSFDV